MACLLVVDDDWAVVRALEEVYEKMGHEVIVCVDGLDAIAQLELRRPAAVISDWQMGEIDGLDVLEAAKQKSPTSRRVLITASPGIAEVRMAVTQGLIDVLVEKPWTLADLRAAIRGL